MNRLKDLREFHGLTQERAAKIGYISKKSYIRYEMGERIMPLDTAVYYAKYYGVSLDYLAGVTDQTVRSSPNEPARTDIPQTVEIVQPLMNTLKRLTDEQQLRLAEFLNSMKKR